MAILQVHDIDDRLYSSLKEIARQENRSLSQEVISILEQYLAQPRMFAANPTQEFLALSQAWSDSRTREEILAEIQQDRTNSKRFGADNGLFD